MKSFRIESDSIGEMQVPAEALYGAQTARALEKFPISALRFPPEFRLAQETGRSVREVAQEMSGLEKAEFEEYLDLAKQTKPGLIGARKCGFI